MVEGATIILGSSAHMFVSLLASLLLMIFV